MFADSLVEQLARTRIVAVVTIEDPSDAVPLGEALRAGGVEVVEVTLRTPAALEAAASLIRHVDGLCVGVGTILTATQIGEAKQIGAAFGVAPGFNPRVVDAAGGAGLPFAPGISTASEIELAVEAGCRVLKVFPAGPLGGPRFLRTLSAPYRHLGLKFIPLGGIGDDDVDRYRELEDVLAIGGSWFAPPASIRARDFGTIKTRAAAAVAAASGAG
ncbi:MAG: bifunctional 4-hydroxy-2-oxoglutarate aldolase/2-dehydro-3-deoxy-phosphogluconate aldolase [Planctomycetota bacterium]